MSLPSFRLRFPVGVVGRLALLGLVLATAACAGAPAQPTASADSPTRVPAAATAVATNVAPSPSAPAPSLGSASSPTAVPPTSTEAPSATATVISTVTPAASAQSVRVVAAENFYGDLAAQIGGNRVKVVSILSDPNADPHEYESNADDAKAVANAQVVIKNGLGYDAFVDKLMAASPRPNRIVIDAGELTGHREGDNPHVWYDPATMPKVAHRLAEALSQLDPADRDYFAGQLTGFDASEQAVDDRIAAIRTTHRGARVLVTEPVFDDMAEALGLDVVDRDGAFPKAVEDGNDPPASAVVQLRSQLASHAVKALIYNSQTVTPITTQMQDLAKSNRVPVVPVSETEPQRKTYQQWMLDELATLQQALAQ